MKTIAVALALAVLQIAVYGQTSPQRPRILGIDHVSFYTTSPDGVKNLYGEVLGLASADPVEPGAVLRYEVGKQWVGYSPAPDPKSTDRMDHVALTTENIAGLRKYLIAQGIKVPQIQGRSDHSLFFVVNDPEGHRIEFVERGKSEAAPPAEAAVTRRMIHAGFLVYHRDVEDHFYRDILGFRPYWYGGMKDNQIDWVALQVPDGSDWVEYMLNRPEHPDLRTSGVMNHISLGVVDMKQAQAALESHGWKPHGNEKAQLGRDGKWQLNVYDPDLTRVELMEFKPAQTRLVISSSCRHPTLPRRWSAKPPGPICRSS